MRPLQLRAKPSTQAAAFGQRHARSSSKAEGSRQWTLDLVREEKKTELNSSTELSLSTALLFLSLGLGPSLSQIGRAHV